MTPKEKAQDLVDRMERPINDDYYLDFNNYAKKCALIAVDEILGDIDEPILHPENQEAITYWNEVKQEIEAL